MLNIFLSVLGEIIVLLLLEEHCMLFVRSVGPHIKWAGQQLPGPHHCLAHGHGSPEPQSVPWYDHWLTVGQNPYTWLKICALQNHPFLVQFPLWKLWLAHPNLFTHFDPEDSLPVPQNSLPTLRLSHFFLTQPPSSSSYRSLSTSPSTELENSQTWLGTVTHKINPSTQEGEARVITGLRPAWSTRVSG